MLHFLGGGQGEDSTGSLYQGPEGNSRDLGIGQNTQRDLPRGHGRGIGKITIFGIVMKEVLDAGFP